MSSNHPPKPTHNGRSSDFVPQSTCRQPDLSGLRGFPHRFNPLFDRLPHGSGLPRERPRFSSPGPTDPVSGRSHYKVLLTPYMPDYEVPGTYLPLVGVGLGGVQFHLVMPIRHSQKPCFFDLFGWQSTTESSCS